MSGRQDQQKINWEFRRVRKRQEDLLEDCSLPDSVANDGKTVRRCALKAVLLAIDSFSRGKGECFASVPEIAHRANLSPRHVARCIWVLEYRLSLICCETKKAPSGKVCNHYRIVWTELELLANPKFASDQTAPGPDQTAPGPDQTAPGRAHTELLTERKLNNTGPDPVAEAGPNSFETTERQRTSTSVEPLREVTLKGQQQARTSALETLIGEVPELQAARTHVVEPLAPGNLIYGGAFSELVLTEAVLRSPLELTLWFRRQLGWKMPVTGNSAAHLLIVLGTARYALSIEREKVKVSRVAAFVGAFKAGAWYRALPHIPVVAPLLTSGDVIAALITPDGTIAQSPAEPARKVAHDVPVDDLERDWGPRLDSLTVSELQELAAGLPDFFRQRFRKNHSDFGARSYLLKLLRDRWQARVTSELGATQ